MQIVLGRGSIDKPLTFNIGSGVERFFPLRGLQSTVAHAVKITFTHIVHNDNYNDLQVIFVKISKIINSP